MAGAFGLMFAFAPELLVAPGAVVKPRRSWWDRVIPLVLLPVIVLTVIRHGGLPLSAWLCAIVPLMVISAAGAIDRRARRTAAPRELLSPRRTLSFAFGSLALAAAFVAVVAMIVQGHPC